MRPRGALLLAALAASLLGVTDALAEEPPPEPEPEHRWHTPRRGARPLPRSQVEAHPDDWNPLSPPVAELKGWLKQVGVTSDTWVMLFYQAATRDPTGPNHYATFAWRTIGDLELFTGSPVGAGYLEWNLNGTVGMNYDEEEESLSINAGIVSTSNTNVFPNPAALDELFWKQVWPEERFVVMAGRIDHSFHFDANRVAFDSYTKLISFSLVNNLAIPWPLYGGLGGLVHWKANEHLTLRIGGGGVALRLMRSSRVSSQSFSDNLPDPFFMSPSVLLSRPATKTLPVFSSTAMDSNWTSVGMVLALPLSGETTKTHRSPMR